MGVSQHGAIFNRPFLTLFALHPKRPPATFNSAALKDARG